MNFGSQYYLQHRDLFKLANLLFIVFLLVVSSFEVCESRFLVKTLPGLIGDLPSKLETGYIEVGESNGLEYFYYFVESEGNPINDPLILWLAGGPGCSAIFPILYENGPLTINYANSTLEKLTLEINPHRWTQVANIIYLDQPAGSGFSYAKTHEGYITNDTFTIKHAYQFLMKWFVDHPKFLKNPFYVGGDSYSGILVPMIVQEVYSGNEVGKGPLINIKGYMVGNPLTDNHNDNNFRIQYAHHMALLSDAIYKETKEHCHGEYMNVDPNNTLCINDLQVVKKCLGRIQLPHILEPICETSNTIKPNFFGRDLRSLDNTAMHVGSLPDVKKKGCRDDNYLYSAAWANSKMVREALHIREEFNNIEWVICNASLSLSVGSNKPISYTYSVLSSVAYHQNLTHKKCRALVYSGDHDMQVPYLSTMNWIESLNLLIVNDWRPWFIDEQVAGYTLKYSNHDYNLTFATVKGGGHTTPEYKPMECFNMIIRWLTNDAL